MDCRTKQPRQRKPKMETIVALFVLVCLVLVALVESRPLTAHKATRARGVESDYLTHRGLGNVHNVG